MRALETAKVERRELPKLRLQFAIHHQPIPGITGAMMRWWFEHIDGETLFNGRDFTGPCIASYLLWHKRDHIEAKWKQKVLTGDGHVGPGSILAVQENLCGRQMTKSDVMVTQLDDTAFNFDLGNSTARVGYVRHLYTETPAGLAMTVEMTFGAEWPLLWRFFNPLLHKKAFTADAADAWMQHNVEEIGELENFLPALYREATRSH